MASNAPWVVWGGHDSAHAPIAQQAGLFVMNWRGATNDEA